MPMQRHCTPYKIPKDALLKQNGHPSKSHLYTRVGLLQSTNKVVVWVGRAGSQLEKLVLLHWQPCRLGLMQALALIPWSFHQCKPAQGEQGDAQPLPRRMRVTLPSQWHKAAESPCGSGLWQPIQIRAIQKLRIYILLLLTDYCQLN